MSPRNDKNIFIVENYPQKIDRLPTNMGEVVNRYKDILFSDKDMVQYTDSKVDNPNIHLIEELYDTFEKSIDKSKISAEELKK